VLEAVRTRTKTILKQGIQVGDIVQTNFFYAGIKRIALQNELRERGIAFEVPVFDWEDVIGAVLWLDFIHFK
jgi:hypothetical protein